MFATRNTAVALALALCTLLGIVGSASAKITLFEHFYSGQHVTLYSSVADFPRHNHLNDKASSVTVSEGEVWILYAHTHFRGHSLVVYGGNTNLIARHFNDKISSAQFIGKICPANDYY